MYDDENPAAGPAAMQLQVMRADLGWDCAWCEREAQMGEAWWWTDLGGSYCSLECASRATRYHDETTAAAARADLPEGCEVVELRTMDAEAWHEALARTVAEASGIPVIFDPSPGTR